VSVANPLELLVMLSEAVMDRTFEIAESMANRRERLGKQMNVEKLTCPECETRQLQLIAYLDEPAKWKCRRCRHIFIKELISMDWVEFTTESQPPERGLYLRTNGTVVETLWFDFDGTGGWWENDEGSLICGTTHWAVLPAPPAT